MLMDSPLLREHKISLAMVLLKPNLRLAISFNSNIEWNGLRIWKFLKCLFGISICLILLT